MCVVLNIAEGSGKNSVAEKRRFYSIAMGSLREVQALLDLIEQNGLIELADQVAAHLYKLIQNPGAWSRS
ncbi:MAG: four helix bundle protein [Deltaproteobacteria bacterium]|nr:four helix bundle protein [Deltaproteobacteria bacterium]